MLISIEGSFIVEFSFSSYPLNDILFSFLFDYISLLFFFTVSLISCVIFLYSKFYFKGSPTSLDYKNVRYTYILALFVVSIFFLVFSGSFLTVMIGWDGLGLVSFLLVIFYNNPSSLDSGLLTILTNRVGDCLFILRFLMIYSGGWFFIDFLSSPYFEGFILLRVLGCITKRAQIPFSSWLPSAIAAPTPVSSLVHSSTLVTAGVYLIIRFNFLFSSVYWIITPLSLFTIILGGVAALSEVDMKKVVAMSTLSQLGFMVFVVSIGGWSLGFFHIVFHAFFKRAIFLRLGSLIHQLRGGQDSRFFGSLLFSRFSKLVFCSRCLSLMGFPFSLGFYSKDLILGVIISGGFSLTIFFFLLGCILTVAYRVRLISLRFLGPGPSFYVSTEFKEFSFFYFPVTILFFCCVLLGNFFLFFFFTPVILSFLEFSIGLFLIFLGVLLHFFYFKSYFFFNYFSNILFLSSVFSYFSSVLKIVPRMQEPTWGEIFGGEGVSLLVSRLQFIFKPSFRLYFYPPSILVFLVFLIILY